jgi:hypothetical protein
MNRPAGNMKNEGARVVSQCDFRGRREGSACLGTNSHHGERIHCILIGMSGSRSRVVSLRHSPSRGCRKQIFPYGTHEVFHLWEQFVDIFLNHVGLFHVVTLLSQFKSPVKGFGSASLTDSSDCRSRYSKSLCKSLFIWRCLLDTHSL